MNCNKKRLVGQLLALQLNVRYNKHFRGTHLDSLVLAESCALTAGQVAALGLSNTATVQDLIRLANQYLASNCSGKSFPANFGSLINNALTTLNEKWDECRGSDENPCEVVDGSAPAERTGTPDSASGDDLELTPNPAFASVRLTWQAETAGPVWLRIFDMNGRMVQTITLDVVVGRNTTTLDVSGFDAGVFWLNLTGNQMAVTKRFVVYRD